ncbi:hypothetical protein P3754_30770, partial [Pseudomonas aeruginosa]|nr:hypothetical protein [Pseudomonas aeruginosa]
FRQRLMPICRLLVHAAQNPGKGRSPAEPADNRDAVIRIWTPPGLPVFVLISNLCTTASVYPASWSGVATPEP